MQRVGDGQKNPLVALSDTDGERIRLLSSVLDSLGESADLIECEPAAGANFRARRAVLVALDRGDERQRIEFIRQLHRLKVRVIAYADHAGEWPVAKRCLALLAGAATVMDSAAADFEATARGQVAHLLNRERERAAREQRAKDAMRQNGIVGESAATVDAFLTILRIAPLSDLPVLLTGETGTGKEMFARAIHQLDAKRAGGPMVAVNCAAIPASIAESEFFGHRRGAFTGAEQDRRGLFRAAHRGVLLLDEINELETALQAKLLRVLQDGRITAVGDEREVEVDIRVVAATNCNLPELVRSGRFREDLYYRLNVLAVHIPPLRERMEDLTPLTEHFMSKHRALSVLPPSGVDDEFLDALRRNPMPGNVRQLENLIRWVLVHKEDGGLLRLRDLPGEILTNLTDERARKPASYAEPRTDYFERLFEECGSLSGALDQCEKQLLQLALKKAHGNQAKAARLTGLTPRSIYNKIRKHGLQAG